MGQPAERAAVAVTVRRGWEKPWQDEVEEGQGWRQDEVEALELYRGAPYNRELVLLLSRRGASIGVQLPPYTPSYAP